MEVQKIEGNCSMLSISNNPHADLTERQFLKLLYDAIVRYNNKAKNSEYPIGDRINLNEVKCVMLTTNLKFYLWRLFSKGFSYWGNSTRKARVKFITFPSGGLKIKLLKEGII